MLSRNLLQHSDQLLLHLAVIFYKLSWFCEEQEALFVTAKGKIEDHSTNGHGSARETNQDTSGLLQKRNYRHSPGTSSDRSYPSVSHGISELSSQTPQTMDGDTWLPRWVGATDFVNLIRILDARMGQCDLSEHVQRARRVWPREQV